jgi:hypothetical protein
MPQRTIKLVYAIALIQICTYIAGCCACETNSASTKAGPPDTCEKSDYNNIKVARHSPDKFDGTVFYVWGSFQDRTAHYLEENPEHYSNLIRKYGGDISDDLNESVNCILLGYPSNLVVWKHEGGFASEFHKEIVIGDYDKRYAEIIAWAEKHNIDTISEDVFHLWLWSSHSLSPLNTADHIE